MQNRPPSCSLPAMGLSPQVTARLAIFDLDGTLLDGDSRPPAAEARADWISVQPLVSGAFVVRCDHPDQIALGLIGDHLEQVGEVLPVGGELDANRRAPSLRAFGLSVWLHGARRARPLVAFRFPETRAIPPGC